MLGRVIDGALYVVLALLAVANAVVGAFLVPRTLGPGIPVALIYVTVANYLLAVHGGRTLRHHAGAVLPSFLWLVVTVYIGSGRPEGDVVITNSAVGLGYILLGALAAAIGIGRARSSAGPAGR